MFQLLRDRADELFLNMPPPVPAPVVVPPPQPAAIVRGGAGVAAAPGASRVVPPARDNISMQSYYSRNNVCVAGHCRVLLADGRRVRADAIQRGDRVISRRATTAVESLTQGPGTANSMVATVRCVVRSSVSDRADAKGVPMVAIGDGLLITPWHPVRQSSTSPWVFPADVGDLAWHTDLDAVFSFVLDAGCSMIVDGIECAVLGHGVKSEGPVLAHAFFGTAAVVDALANLPGWDAGHVSLRPQSLIRDPITHHVVGLRV